jgi:hypothetical protein
MIARNLIRPRRRAGAQDKSRAKAAQRRTSMAERLRSSVVISIRAISTGQLQRLLVFHPRPINVVVSHDPSPLRD